MKRTRIHVAITLSLLLASSASGQVVGGKLTVTGAEMH
jgi:hypothetical protein